MLQRIVDELATLPACFDDAHNQRIMAKRARLASASRALALAVNRDWFWRAWQTPDIAMCLGRYDTVTAVPAKRRAKNGWGCAGCDIARDTAGLKCAKHPKRKYR